VTRTGGETHRSYDPSHVANEPTAPQTLLTGLVFGEQPRWHDGRLWLSDWGTREVIAVDLDGSRETMLEGTGFPLCVDWLPDGRMLVVSAREGLLLRREPDGSLVTHADLNGAAPRAPGNELVVDGRGNAYVNGPGFDLAGGGEFAPGCVVLAAPDGAARQVADDIAFPNGMVVTADNATLIVADSYGKCLFAFDIEDDGGLANRRVWADLGDGVPDGICMDADDAVWYADVPNRCCVRVREGGEVLQTIELDRGGFACALGGPDRATLFIVATEWRGPAAMFAGPPSGQVLAVPAPAPGVPFP
jgi:sugar lactone lactonase YvrE